MCAIIDLNVVGDVFKRNRSRAEEQFFDWLERPGARLVIGGKLWKEELRRNGNFAAWAQEGLRAGRVKEFPEDAVNEESDVVSAEGLCKSDDPHIIGLARVSRARLLYFARQRPP
ncbi:hypothetical protein [Candidatus Palauibacter sp.]|uniref:hypothetical protein n=1 Tax=Candidatus Palauibacter sp. TaxID=3101350 RepID=UPI003AF256EB